MKVVLVTGVAGGIGVATAKRFVVRGWRVIDVEVATLDVTDEGRLRALIQGIAETHGRLDALVNSAGVPLAKPIARDHVGGLGPRDGDRDRDRLPRGRQRVVVRHRAAIRDRRRRHGAAHYRVRRSGS